MSVKQIDSVTGNIKVSSDFWASKYTRIQDLINQFGTALLDITQMGSDWSRIQLSPLEVDGEFFVFVFYFQDNLLRSINFSITDSLLSKQTWENWNEEEEIQKKAQFDDWLTNQLGDRRKFSWGSVQAYYDAKSGGSGIILRYMDAFE